MTKVCRFDYGQMGEAERTPQGFLKIPGFVTRVGVFTYTGGDGRVRRELRHPDDVFAPESLATLRNMPVTIEHPPEMITPENARQYMKGYTTERVEVNRDLIEADVIIADEEAIRAVEEDGLRETSCGYFADVEEEEGVYEGAPYNYRQRNIRGNHLAIVRHGRAGPEVRLRLDSADAIMDDRDEISIPGRAEFTTGSAVMNADAEGKTKPVVISGQTVDLPNGIADIVQDMIDRYDELRAKVSQVEDSNMKDLKEKKDVDVSQPGVSPQVQVAQGAPDGRKAPAKIGAGDTGGAARAKGDEEEDKPGFVKDEDEKEDAEMAPGGVAQSPIDLIKSELAEIKALLSGKVDTMQAKVDEFAAKNLSPAQPGAQKTDSADVQKLVRSRAKLERRAEKFVDATTVEKFDSMSDDEIRRAVILAKHPKADLADKSSVYLQSRFDSIIEGEQEEVGRVERIRAGKALMGGERNDGAEAADPAQARVNMIKASRELYTQPLSASKK